MCLQLIFFGGFVSMSASVHMHSKRYDVFTDFVHVTVIRAFSSLVFIVTYWGQPVPSLLALVLFSEVGL